MDQNNKKEMTGVKVGGMSFSTRPKEFHSPPKPFQIPESKDFSRIQNAEKILNVRRVTGFVELKRGKGRDEHLFGLTDD